MKKVKNVDMPETPEDEPTDEPSAPIIPLRTETALSRFPLHRLAKKAIIKKIQQRKKDTRGKTITTWEVTNPPGPLAYKVDAIVVSRRIDESRPDIPKLLKLGSLRDICKEIGISPEGKNTQAVKEALRENAFAGITARLDYKGQDGAERHFEFSDTRYGVILTGERLPNGQKADAVYINFHDIFLSLLHHSQTRPLDYEYLRVLPPASQRLYELLSFIVFGALRHGRKCATMLYSELCANAPLTRYYEWDKGKKQLYKLHKPHIERGYLAKVEYEEISGTDGRPDWIIRYTPGPKAKREYKVFTKRKEEEQKEPAPKSAPRLVPAALLDPLRAVADRAGADDPLMVRRVERLVAAGFGRSAATDLASEYPDECDRQLDALPLRDMSDKPNPVGWLRCAIREGYSTPTTPEEGSPSARAAQRNEAVVKQANAEKTAACLFCQDSELHGKRRVFTEKQPNGAWRTCTHDPEIESKFRAERTH
jgi:hypothetical protein